MYGLLLQQILDVARQRIVVDLLPCVREIRPGHGECGQCHVSGVILAKHSGTGGDLRLGDALIVRTLSRGPGDQLVLGHGHADGFAEVDGGDLPGRYGRRYERQP